MEYEKATEAWEMLNFIFKLSTSPKLAKNNSSTIKLPTHNQWVKIVIYNLIHALNQFIILISLVNIW